MMGSYMALCNAKPDLMLSSSALRAQITSDKLAKKMKYKGPIHYMNELYMVRPETLINIMTLQDDKNSKIFLVGHNPELSEFIKFITDEEFIKLPTLGIVSISFDIDSWEEIKENTGVIDFFISPKQFKYYIPKQIRTTWDQR